MTCNIPDWLRENKDIRHISPLAKEHNDSAFGPSTATVTTTSVLPSFSEIYIESANPTAGASADGNDNSKANEDSHSNKDGKETTESIWYRAFARDSRLLIITILMLVGMNVPKLRYVFYPFVIFSTWIHEECHAFAALIVGGTVERVLIYPDASGLAYVYVVHDDQASIAFPFVITAGYLGTAVVGTLLLLLRRTKRGPRASLMFLGLVMLITTVIWTRNLFGVLMSIGMALCLIVASWKLTSWWMNNFYMSLAVLTSLNAISRVSDLFGAITLTNGQPRESDAHTMALYAGGTALQWAFAWLIFALTMTILGIIFAIPGPDEVADFALCRICQKMGCFFLCNHRKTTIGSGSNATTSNDDETPAVTLGA